MGAALLLLFLVLAAFCRVLTNKFVSYDDQLYVTGNFHVQSGLTLAGVKWAFSTMAGANWHPLTWLSHMLDYNLFRLQPWGHHLTSLLLHAANAVLTFIVLQRMTGAFWRSWFVAALFGLHPMHAESVAWVAERKDVLSLFFGWLTLWAFLRYASSITRPRSTPVSPPSSPSSSSTSLGFSPHPRFSSPAFAYFLSLFFFACGLMCKPMLVTLPCVLLLLDYWPLRRLENNRIGFLVLEKAPFILLAAVASVITWVAQQTGNAITNTAALPMGDRLENVLVAYVIYLGKLFLPVHLAVIYPFQNNWPLGTVVLCGAVLAGITVAAAATRRRWPWFLVGWLWFLGTLVPVIGLVQVGSQGMADRYSYWPFVGLFIVISWGIELMTRNWRHRTVIGCGTAAAAIALCAALSWRQEGFWKNDATLFQHAVSVTQDNFIALANLGQYELEQGHTDRAIDLNRQSIQLMPNFATAYGQLGMALCKAGHPDEGIHDLRQALQMDPKLGQTHADLADALAQTGQYDEAIMEYQEAIRLEPDNLDACDRMGVALESAGRLDDAVACLENAVRLYPGFIDARNNLGLAFEDQGRLDQALAEYQEALRLDPAFARGHFNLGMILKKQGRLDEAIAQFQQGVKLDPSIAPARNELGLMLGQAGKWNEAVVQFQAAVTLKPDFSDARTNLSQASVMAARTNGQ
jgi:tetratricopeptide (TPR) repeat protein